MAHQGEDVSFEYVVINVSTVANNCRDGKNPEEVVKQILQIHAILPGQKPDQQYNIPERTHTQESAQPTETSPQHRVPPVVAHQSSQPIPHQPEPTAHQYEQPQQFQQHQQSQQPQQVQQSQQVQQPQQPLQSLQPQQSQQPHQPVQYQDIQQGVGNINLDGPAALEPSRSLTKKSVHMHAPDSSVLSQRQGDNISPERKAQIAAELPPSTLLHSNPKQEARRNDRLHRTDSETQETDEFVDAQS
jgi:hypothetical protein